MHFLRDTSEEDGEGECYWPDAFKRVIREEVQHAIGAELNEYSLQHVYKNKYYNNYLEKYPDLRGFIDKIVDLIIIGAENGADNGFDAIYRSFLNESPLPEGRKYARYFWPHIFSQELKEKINRAIADEYSQDKGFQYAYDIGYTKSYDNFKIFIDEIAQLIILAIMKGVDDTLGEIYKAFYKNRTLPQKRRNPKRLRDW